MSLDLFSVLVGMAVSIAAQWLLAAFDVGRLVLRLTGRGRLADQIGWTLLALFLLAAAACALWWMADAWRLVAVYLSRRF